MFGARNRPVANLRVDLESMEYCILTCQFLIKVGTLLCGLKSMRCMRTRLLGSLPIAAKAISSNGKHLKNQFLSTMYMQLSFN